MISVYHLLLAACVDKLGLVPRPIRCLQPNLVSILYMFPIFLSISTCYLVYLLYLLPVSVRVGLVLGLYAAYSPALAYGQFACADSAYK